MDPNNSTNGGNKQSSNVDPFSGDLLIGEDEDLPSIFARHVSEKPPHQLCLKTSIIIIGLGEVHGHIFAPRD